MTGSVTFSTAIGGDGSTVTDDDNATTGLRNGGWRTRFVPCFTNQVSIANYVVTKANEAAASQTAAGSSATSASTSASTATTKASEASTSATNATTSASNASTSASTASTQATNAASSASSASGSATAASGSASTATTQAGIATTQATNAATSASTATTQASNASTSATNAASSATAAAASYDSFDDRYLGAKSSNPTVDNDGNALLTGALYWNTTSSEMRVYSGSAWTAAYIPSSGYLALTGGTMTGAITFAAGQFGTNVATFLATPSSANLATALTDETGTGVNVFNNTPTLITPILGTPTSGTLTNCTFPTLNQNTTGTAAGLSATLAIASGGTNSTATPTAGGAGYGTGTAHAYTAAGTSGQVLTSNGAAAPTWAAASGGGTKTISNKTGAYTVVAGDLGTIINCTSGTFTVSLTAAASLGSGFTCNIWNTSNTATDAITIDPNASETIEGFTTWVLRSGEGLAVVCNGTNWLIDDKKPMRAYAENAITHSRPVATGEESVAIGGYCTSAGAYSFSANYGTANGIASIAFGGYNLAAIAGANYSVAFGNNSGGNGSVTATGAGAMALGGSYASGTDSFAAAIGNNTSSYGAKAAGAIALGPQAIASQQGAISLSYNSAISSGYNSFAQGYVTTADALNSIALGDGSNTKGVRGKFVFSGCSFSATASGAGKIQMGHLVLTAYTTTTTAVVLTSDTGAASTNNQLIVASDQAMAIQGTLIAKVVGTGAMAGWNITGIVSNNGGTMAVSGLALTAIGSDSITLGASPTIAVDNTNKGVTITSGYKSATSIRWVATVNTSEVIA